MLSRAVFAPGVSEPLAHFRRANRAGGIGGWGPQTIDRNRTAILLIT